MKIKSKNSTTIQPEHNWFEFQQKNKPQQNAVAAGVLVFMTGGYHVGWGILNTEFRNEKWAHNESNLFINLIINIYYIGVIIGLLLSIVLQFKLSKKVIYCVASVITILTSILLICWPTNAINIMIVRLVFGIANGFVLPTTIIHVGEVAIKEIRGMLLGIISYCFNITLCSMLILVLSFTFHRNVIKIETTTLVGILALFNGLIALIAGLFLFIESPIYLIKQNKPDEALNTIKKLRKEKVVTTNIVVQYEDMKTLINEDNKLSSSILSDKNMRPIILVGFVVLLNILSVNLPINFIRIKSILYKSDNLTVTLIAIFIRSLFGIFCLLFIDRIGRKKILLYSGTLAGITLIIHGILINAIDDLSLISRIVIFLAYELFLSFGLSSVQHIYLGEAFPLTKKMNSIVVITILENAIHIILIATTMNMDFTLNNTSIIVFIFGGLMVLLTAFIHYNVPETARLTLREASREFK